jgi:hypothetical protein
MKGRLSRTQHATRTSVVTPRSVGGGGSGLASLQELQRSAGNGAVTRLLRAGGTAGSQRLPSPSAASAVPARIKGMQLTFHERMTEANAIMKGTRDHYNYVNGIYAECFKIHQVVVGQAHEEEVQNERIAEAIVATASLALSFAAPEGEAVGVLAKILENAHKIDEWRERLEKAKKIGEAIEKGGEKTQAGEEGGPTAPSELQILGLEHVNELLFKVADVHNEGDAVFDKAVDMSTEIEANAPDSGAIDAEQGEALDIAEAACQEILSSVEELLADLRVLRDRRKVTIPSWRETEQDIWIAYFASRHEIGTEDVLRNHMVDIELWGPPGQPGGRLGVAETEGSISFYRDPKVVPEHEDEEHGQTVGPTTMEWMAVVEAEQALLPPKWQRIMLLAD